MDKKRKFFIEINGEKADDVAALLTNLFIYGIHSMVLNFDVVIEINNRIRSN